MNQLKANILHAFLNLHVSLPTLFAAGLGVSAVIWPAYAIKLASIAAILGSYGLIAAANTPQSLQVPPSSSSSSSPRVPMMLFAFACLSLSTGLFFTGCKSSPQQVTYDAADATVVTVDTAMTAWGNYVAATHPSTNEEFAVESAYEKYQASMAVVCDAGEAYAATGGTNATATAALNAAIANSGQELSDLENLLTTFGVQLK